MSPTVGTILMVAVVAALGGMLFVELQKANEESAAPQGLPLVEDETKDHLLVASAGSEQAWEDYAIRTDAVGLRFAIGTEPASGTDDEVPAAFAMLPGGPVRGGEALWFCADAPLTDVTVWIQDIDANAIIHRADFADIAQC